MSKVQLHDNFVRSDQYMRIRPIYLLTAYRTLSLLWQSLYSWIVMQEEGQRNGLIRRDFLILAGG
jgi:hypothetical protein